MENKTEIEEEFYKDGKPKFYVEYIGNELQLHKEWNENGILLYEESLTKNISNQVSERKISYFNGEPMSYRKSKTQDVADVNRYHIMIDKKWYENGILAKDIKLGSKSKYFNIEGEKINEDEFKVIEDSGLFTYDFLCP